jgi:pyruvate/2-oxoglutarate dehydrogenase complex dihydrolipoamide acyltransferase (E2) component
MAPPKKKGKLTGSTKWYREHSEGRKKKAATTHKNNQKPERKKKMAESTKARKEAIKRGVNVSGKDMSHKNGRIVAENSSKNRGAKGNSSGDRRARGKGCKRK